MRTAAVYQGVSIMEIRDGKIAKETDYFAQPFDAAAVARAMGRADRGELLAASAAWPPR